MKGLSSRFRTTPSRQDLDLDHYRQQQLMDDFDKSPFMGDYIEEHDMGVSRINPLNQNMNYSSGLPSSPLRLSSSPSFEPNQMMNARSTAFAQRSQSFIDRGTFNRQSVSSMMPSKLSDWGSPDGKLNWGVQNDELNKLRKSASFGVRGSSDSIINNQEPDSQTTQTHLRS